MAIRPRPHVQAKRVPALSPWARPVRTRRPRAPPNSLECERRRAGSKATRPQPHENSKPRRRHHAGSKATRPHLHAHQRRRRKRHA
eukprot:2209324-Alexandrium_andersonii.AAC.1